MLDGSAILIERDAPADAELVARIRRGDHAAFAALMRRHNRRLFRVARSLLRDDGEAEDVVQETCLRAFAGLGRFRGEASLSTWLTGSPSTRPSTGSGAAGSRSPSPRSTMWPVRRRMAG
jgi:hypothetical protein